MNNQLSHEALVIYVRNLRTLEFIRYKCKQSVQNINNKAYKMECELNDIKRLVPKMNMGKPTFLDSLLTSILIIGGILFACGFIILILLLVLDDEFILQALGVIVAIFVISTIIIHAFNLKAYRNDEQRYLREKMQYNDNVSHYTTRLNKFKSDAKAYTSQLNTYIQQIDNMLQKEYSLNIIPKQFRDIYGVTYLYDFLSTSQLSLSDAVLNYQLDRIKRKLDIIISKCDKIIWEMRQLNSTMNEIKRQNNKLLEELENISYNAELSAQYSQITATNSAVALELQKKQLAYQEVDFWLNSI